MSFRIFISYSRSDRAKVLPLVGYLTRSGFDVLWDEEIVGGNCFTEQIKSFIEHAHLVVPVLTSSSQGRIWTHHEIGYALALNISILPVSIGVIPQGIIGSLQPVSIAEDFADLPTKLTKDLILRSFEIAADGKGPRCELAEERHDRAPMMARYAKEVLEMGRYGMVRQFSILSSFAILDRPETDPAWRDIYGVVENHHYWRTLRAERQALNLHAAKAGCALILMPHVELRYHGTKAKSTRLRSLLAFLRSCPSKVVVAFNEETPPREEALTLVGDWFSAWAPTSNVRKGRLGTVFTRHAATVSRQLNDFDVELEQTMVRNGITPEESRTWAIARLEEILFYEEQKTLKQDASKKGAGNDS